MSKTIKVDSELLLYALKYAIANGDANSDKIIISIGRENLDKLDNQELKRFIQVIKSEDILESKGKKYTWQDLKETLEKEIEVRESVEKIMKLLR